MHWWRRHLDDNVAHICQPLLIIESVEVLRFMEDGGRKHERAPLYLNAFIEGVWLDAFIVWKVLHVAKKYGRWLVRSLQIDRTREL